MSTYDYVIVGAGSAGCVLAARLTEDPDVRVLLVEAGPPDTSDFVHIPAAFSALFRTERDWDHMTGWEPGCNGRRIYLPRGRMLGGSSSMNAMIYIRGNRADFLEAADAFGLPANPDFNAAEQDGVGWYQVTQRDGKRASAAVAYLHPAMERPNLEGRTGCQVLRVLFEGTRAVGIQAAEGAELVELRAEREVIVSAGAYNSPHLLMLSGLGRPEELAALQIPVVAEAPEVGLNLSDHPTAGVVWATEEECSLKDALHEENLAHWMGGGGPLTSNLAESGGLVRTRDRLQAPHIQFPMVAAMYMQEGLLPPPAHGITL